MSTSTIVSLGGKQVQVTVTYIGTDSAERFVEMVNSVKAEGATNYAALSTPVQQAIRYAKYMDDATVRTIAGASDVKGTATAFMVTEDFWKFSLSEQQSSPATNDSGAGSSSETVELPDSLATRERARGKITLVSAETGQVIIECAEIQMTGMTVQDRERMHLVQCFDSVHMQTFGRSPIAIDVRGVLLDAENAPWYSTFAANYETYFRASQATSQRGLVVLDLDGVMIEGHIVGMSIGRDATRPLAVDVSFPMVAYKVTPTGGTTMSVVNEVRNSSSSSNSGSDQQQQQDAAAEQAASTDQTPQQSDTSKVWEAVVNKGMQAAAGLISMPKDTAAGGGISGYEVTVSAPAGGGNTVKPLVSPGDGEALKRGGSGSFSGGGGTAKGHGGTGSW